MRQETMFYKVQLLCPRKNQSVIICVLMYFLQMFEKILAIVCRNVLSEKAVSVNQECLISNHC
jgi:hypothetical protein